ncbi:MAG: CHASE2 domain-containing protein, partial [Burkholderiaceae bacterium]
MKALDLRRLFAATSALRFYVGLSAALAVCAAASLFLQWDERVQGSTYDWMVKHRFRTPHTDPDIVIIDIDERSLAQMSAEFGSWPWPRDIFAAVLANLESQKAQAVVFDILFSDPDRQRTEGDHAFADVIAHSRASYFPVLRLNAKNDAISTIRASDHAALVTPEPDHLRPNDRTLALVFPYFVSAVGNDRFGTFNATPDADGVIRHQALWESIEGWRIASLPMRLGNAFGWTLPSEKIHLLQWMNKPLAYKTVSFADVYFDSQKKTNERPHDEFKNKIVLIGSTAAGLSDLRGTSLASIHPGVDILATAVDNLKNRRYIDELPRWTRFAMTIVLLLMAAWLSLRYSGLQLNLVFVSVPCMLFLLSYLSLNYLTTFIDLTASAYYVIAYFAIAKLHEFYLMQ